MTSVPSSTTMRMLERVLLRRNGHAVLGGHGDAGAKLRLDTFLFRPNAADMGGARLLIRRRDDFQ